MGYELLLSKLEAAMRGEKSFRIIPSHAHGLEIVEGGAGFEKENCTVLANYLLERRQQLFASNLTTEEFFEVRKLLDQCYLYRKQVDKTGEFEAIFLSLRLGGEISPVWLQENPDYVQFLKVNHLHHRLLVLRLFPPFDERLGAGVPMENGESTEWVYWKDVQKHPLFKVDAQYRLLPGHTLVCRGISPYDTATDPEWKPFQKLDGAEWGHKHVLEVWTVSLPVPKPPMFFRTHAYIVLKDDQGYVRSVGQDVLVTRNDYRITELLNRKPGFGKITTPDVYVFYPTNARRFWKTSIEISAAEHARIVALVEEDKKNKEHSMSVLKGNCVSYVLKLLREGIGVEINASMHGLHILLKAALPSSWYRAFFQRFSPWYTKQNILVKKGLFFIPFIYIPHLLVGVVALFTRQNNYQEIKDFSLKDLIIRPWSLSSDHPLALHRRLEEVYDMIPQIRRTHLNK